MKKRLLALLLALSMTAALAACGGKNEKPGEEPEQVEDTVFRIVIEKPISFHR